MAKWWDCMAQSIFVILHSWHQWCVFSETMTLMGNKVGIGSTAPSTKLDVAGTSKITQTLSVGGASTFASTVYISGNLSVGGSSNLGGVVIITMDNIWK